jgi:hypothetical protein
MPLHLQALSLLLPNSQAPVYPGKRCHAASTMNNIATTIANHSTSKEALDQARQWANQGLGQIERALKEVGPIHAGLENEQDIKARVAASCYAHMVSVLLNLASIERVRIFRHSSLKLCSSDCSSDSLMGSQRWREHTFTRHWIVLHRKDSRPASRRLNSTWRIWMQIDRFPSSKKLFAFPLVSL